MGWMHIRMDKGKSKCPQSGGIKRSQTRVIAWYNAISLNSLCHYKVFIKLSLYFVDLQKRRYCYTERELCLCSAHTVIFFKCGSWKEVIKQIVTYLPCNHHIQSVRVLPLQLNLYIVDETSSGSSRIANTIFNENWQNRRFNRLKQVKHINISW